MADKKKKHKFTHSHVEHFKDGSHVVHHVHKDGAHKDVKHAVKNLDELHDSLQDHLGQPNPGEAEAMGGQHGVPEPMAAQAGLASAAAPGGMGPVA